MGTRKHLIAPTALILFFELACPAAARAETELCRFYRQYIPSLAGTVCSGRQSAKPPGANSTFADGFNINPAKTPTEPSPYGLETIASYIRGGKDEWTPTFAIIKGFKKFGTGVSTSGNSTFYGNDVVRRLYGKTDFESFNVSEKPKGTAPNLNLGTSVPLNPSRNGQSDSVKLGLSARYNKTTDTIGPGIGIAVGDSKLIYGLGISHERVSNFLPPINFLSAMIGGQVLLFELEYTILKSYGHEPALPPIHILTTTANLGRVLLTAAVRATTTHDEGSVTQWHYGVQVMPAKFMSVGFLINYLPGTNSIACQFFL